MKNDSQIMPCILTGIVVIAVISAIATDIYNKPVYKTKKIMNQVADQLDRKEKDSYYVRVRNFNYQDAWGNKMKIEYFPKDVTEPYTHGQEYLVITSSGRDSIFNTLDDLEVSRTNGLLKALGKSAAKVTKEFGKEFVKEMLNDPKDDFLEESGEKAGGIIKKVSKGLKKSLFKEDNES